MGWLTTDGLTSGPMQAWHGVALGVEQIHALYPGRRDRPPLSLSDTTGGAAGHRALPGAVGKTDMALIIVMWAS
jgi:hypothetical protein